VRWLNVGDDGRCGVGDDDDECVSLCSRLYLEDAHAVLAGVLDDVRGGLVNKLPKPRQPSRNTSGSSRRR